MALGKYTRVDNRRSSSSSYCSMVSIVIFVALCLVGVWMMTSSSVVPVQNVDVPEENKDEVKEQVSESNGGNTRQFEDNPGDLPEDATKGDINVNPESSSNTEETQEEKPEEKPEERPEENQEEKTEEKLEEKPDANEDTKSDDGSNTEAGDGERRTDDEEPNSDGGEAKKDGGDGSEQEDGAVEKKSDLNENENKSENSDETKDGEKVGGRVEEKVEQNEKKESDGNSSEKKENDQPQDQSLNEVFPSGAQSEILNETTTQSGAWSTQATESKNEKDFQKSSAQQTIYDWKLCNVTAGHDYIPCLDNWQAIRSLRSTKHYEHRERQCPEEAPTCLVSLPEGYRRPIEWPNSREKVSPIRSGEVHL